MLRVELPEVVTGLGLKLAEVNLGIPPMLNVTGLDPFIAPNDTVSLGAINGSSPVTLSIGGMPKFTSASFKPNPVTTSGSSTLSISANKKARTGTYSLTVTGTNGTYAHSAPLSLIIK